MHYWMKENFHFLIGNACSELKSSGLFGRHAGLLGGCLGGRRRCFRIWEYLGCWLTVTASEFQDLILTWWWTGLRPWSAPGSWDSFLPVSLSDVRLEWERVSRELRWGLCRSRLAKAGAEIHWTLSLDPWSFWIDRYSVPIRRELGLGTSRLSYSRSVCNLCSLLGSCPELGSSGAWHCSPEYLGLSGISYLSVCFTIRSIAETKDWHYLWETSSKGCLVWR